MSDAATQNELRLRRCEFAAATNAVIGTVRGVLQARLVLLVAATAGPDCLMARYGVTLLNAQSLSAASLENV